MIRRITLLTHPALAALLALLPPALVEAQAPAPIQRPKQPEWVKQSDQHSRLMVELMAKVMPEGASELGVDGYDQEISDFSPGFVERQLKAAHKVQAELRGRLEAEKDPRVKQDLEILIKAAGNIIRGTELAEKLEVPYLSLPQLMFQSFHGLLDEQVSPARRPSALVRLRKYTGIEPGTKTITEHATALGARTVEEQETAAADPVQGRKGPGTVLVLCGRDRQTLPAVPDQWIRRTV